ncbi:hypothetical protein A1Q1_07751 [Trichosporon asahii var. asahii CBS 2479]|uniref:Long-chain-fatty-acid--CoA ligase n=1 Tax=Trichosporon asahii var. asahii (strain ATCC 90039 / CBS 2479 / JCM 2466 / KCTC 7840 / NBRC 103889/ NCYC 2677 / UAMH 7654) TaxID=1186058 RepID=J5TIF0_TRIAS|nr:hypothetical protein A1Q1_07751 [Trichosporon asahii var. asahii CBS 2479]EJT51061.1 hypothetical protein A1Q1_07751 [Trichosporon asahii var. asahii CBS 2479]
MGFQKYADRDMYVSPLPNSKDYEVVTYGEQRRRVIRLATWYRSLGLGQGSKVAVGGTNSSQFLVAAWAAHYCGAIPVFINSTLHVDASLHCLGITKPDLVLGDADYITELVPIMDKLKAAGVGPIYTWEPTEHLSADLRRSVKPLPAYTPSKAEIAAVERGDGLEGMNADSDGHIFFTSGTSGMPKAVISNQRAALHNYVSGTFASLRAMLRAGATYEQATTPAPTQASMLVPAPLFHVTGCISWTTRQMTTGAKIVFMKRWSVPEAIRLIEAYNVNVLGGVPATTKAILQSPLLPKERMFTAVSSGGAPIQAGMAAALTKRFPGLSVSNGWGLTETNGLHNALTGRDYLENPESCGPPVPICDIKIIDPETGRECGPEEMGVIWARGSNVMNCYYGNPEATAKVLTPDGWFNTGDMGTVNKEGWLSIRDRQKDIIIRGGENIASAEVENALASLPETAEVAAVAVPDPVLGELVGCAVSLAPGKNLTEAQVLELVAPMVRYAARPVICVIYEGDLDRNANGKIQKTTIKKTVADEWVRRTGGRAWVRNKAKL